jgi:hypothetical protein
MWITGTSPNVTVSNLGIQLLLDRSCPLYTTSPTSNECLGRTTKPATVVNTESSSNGGAIAGALIGGILLGVILTVGAGSVIILLFLWWKKRGGDIKKVQMMKKVDPKSVGTTLATRYVPSTENLHQESTEAGYEPIAAYIKDGSGDRRAANAYEVQAGEEEATKQKKRRKKNSNKEKVMEDESGYVVPDSLWEGKQRPVAPGSATSAQKTSKPDHVTPPAPETTTKVEYDVPEGIEHRNANLNKVKGQRAPQSAQHIPTNTISQKEHLQPQQQQTLTGKGHQKQKLQAKEPPKTTSQPTELSQNNELKKSAARAVLQDDKPTKKNKPLSLQKKENSSKLAVQYHESDTSTSAFGKSGAAPTSKATPQQDHTAVKSKLQNLLTPAASSQPTTKPTHAKLSKQPSTLATESSSGKVQHQAQQRQQQQESQPASKVMAMAQKLQGAVGQASTKAPGPETTDSKSPGTKKKYVIATCTLHACTHGVVKIGVLWGEYQYVAAHMYVIKVHI